MKSKLTGLWKGYSDLFKELLFIKNESNYLYLQLNLVEIIIFLGLLGLIRNTGEVFFDINPYGYWYTMHPSILFTMFFFPLYLSFFSSFVIFNIGKLFGINLKYGEVFSLSFYIQVVHLLIPFIDKVAFKYNFPFEFHITFLPNKIYFFNIIVMTTGIIVAWSITFFVFIKVFFSNFKVLPSKGLVVLLTSFLIIYLPIYHIWPLFNYIFNSIFSIDDHPFNGAPWGYGTFFMICSLIGIIYYLRSQRKSNINNTLFKRSYQVTS